MNFKENISISLMNDEVFIVDNATISTILQNQKNLLKLTLAITSSVKQYMKQVT